MAAKKTYKIGTRGSRLALAQSRIVLAKLSRKFPEASFSLEIIKTKGDKLIDSPLAAVGGKGLFVKEIEEALLRGEIDLAVHSLKDLPTEIPEGLTIGAIIRREEARDAILTHRPSDGPPSPSKMERGIKGVRRIGTSSLRRKAQLLAWRKDWEVVDLRGNLDTRIRKLSAGEVDAIVVAAAGVRRIFSDSPHLNVGNLRIKLLPLSKMLPAPGQGALAIECRRDDPEVQKIIGKLNHRPTELATRAERALLEALGGGCQVPIGAYAKIYGNKMKLEGVVADTKGKVVIRDQGTGNREEPEELGKKLARKLIKAGARTILNEKR